jgi:hypothetical protein
VARLRSGTLRPFSPFRNGEVVEAERLGGLLRHYQRVA